jgi:hypothetical protein
MQLFILAVGKGRASPENTLTQGWLSRLPQGGSLIEVESKFPPAKNEPMMNPPACYAPCLMALPWRFLTHAARIIHLKIWLP